MEQHRKTLIVAYPVVRNVLREKCLVSIRFYLFIRLSLVSEDIDHDINESTNVCY